MHEGDPIDGFERRGESTKLVVILHAYCSSPARMSAVRGVAADCFPDADLLVPALPTGPLSTHSPQAIVRDLLRMMDTVCTARAGGYQEIVLVGHSIGALFARKLYVCACGSAAEAPFEAELSAPELATDRPRPWAAKVERLVLLAGMNRGWQINHHLSPLAALQQTVGVWIAGLFRLLSGRVPLIMAIRRGAPFLTQLRIQWILMRNRGAGQALTVQLLGTVDDMVSPEDNIDLVAGRDFIYLDVPYSGHANVIEMADSRTVPAGGGAPASTRGAARADVLRTALTESQRELARHGILPSDQPLSQQHPDVTDVVFVVHGIRDRGFWTQRIARQVLRRAQADALEVRIATETSSYGYFPMLPFLLPGRRREKTEWLMDQYAEALAIYPNAEFSFVGHSNGTYLIARALRDYPACRFKHVVLAGSVIRRDYDWRAARERGQVLHVLNFFASNDWVVAYFPRVLQLWRGLDLGSAGHDRFDERTAPPDLVQQIGFVDGGHSAALVETNWDAIARFVLYGRDPQVSGELLVERHGALAGIPLWATILAWLAGLAILAAPVVGIASADMAEWLKTVLLMLYALLIWKIVTVL